MTPFNLEPVPSGGELGGTRGMPEPAPDARPKSVAGAVPPTGTKEADVDVDDPAYQLIHRVADKLSPRMRVIFRTAVENAKNTVAIEQLAAAIASGTLEAALQSIDWKALEGELNGMTRIMRAAFEEAATSAAEQFSAALNVELRFDVTNPRAEAWARTLGAQKIRQVTDATKETVRRIIGDAFRDQTTPREAAKLIRDVVGLTNQQADRVKRFRSKLTEAGASADDVDRRTARFSDSLLRKRATLIAGHESMEASGAGQLELWMQADEQSLLPGEPFREVIITPDDRLDELVCEPMDGQRRKLKEPFTTGTGVEMMNHPFHVGCRCASRLVWEEKGLIRILWHGATRAHVLTVQKAVGTEAA